MVYGESISFNVRVCVCVCLSVCVFNDSCQIIDLYLIANEPMELKLGGY